MMTRRGKLGRVSRKEFYGVEQKARRAGDGSCAAARLVDTTDEQRAASSTVNFNHIPVPVRASELASGQGRVAWPDGSRRQGGRVVGLLDTPGNPAVFHRALGALLTCRLAVLVRP